MRGICEHSGVCTFSGVTYSSFITGSFKDKNPYTSFTSEIFKSLERYLAGI